MDTIIVAIFLLYVLLKIRSERDITKAIKNKNVEDISCPCCGYYCSGNGGVGCINKPKLFREQNESSDC